MSELFNWIRFAIILYCVVALVISSYVYGAYSKVYSNTPLPYIIIVIAAFLLYEILPLLFSQIYNTHKKVITKATIPITSSKTASEPPFCEACPKAHSNAIPIIKEIIAPLIAPLISLSKFSHQSLSPAIVESSETTNKSLPLSSSERGTPKPYARLPPKTPSASPGQARTPSNTTEQAQSLASIIQEAQHDPELSLGEFRKGHYQTCADLSYTEGSHALRCISWP